MRSHLVEWLAPLLGRDLAGLLAPSWFAMTGLAWLVVCAWVLRRARRAGAEVSRVAVVLAGIYAAALISGIALPALAAALESLARGDGWRLRWAGMTSYAGYAAGALAGFLLLRRDERVPPARFADLLAAPMALGLAIGRLGCFLAGCDYGQVTSVPWAVRFPAGSPAWRGQVGAGWLAPDRAGSLPVHPTQLYESLLALGLCALALALGRTGWARRRDGRTFAAVIAGYSVGRLLIENVRGDAGRGIHGPFSAAQIVFALVLAAIAVAAVRRRRALATAIGAALVLMGAGGRALAEEAASVERDQRGLRVSGFLAAGAPLNRRDQQVPAMGGASLTAELDLGRIAFGLDLASMANAVAAHQSAMLVFGAGHALTDSLSAAGRVGLGMTLVNFEDPAFADVATAGLRLGGELEYAVARHWAITVRPMEIDLIDARTLGGPIVSYQFQLGLTFRGGGRGRPADRAPAATPPPQPYPPAPYPYPPAPYPYPYPYPPPQQPAPPPQQPAPPPPQPAPAPAPPPGG